VWAHSSIISSLCGHPPSSYLDLTTFSRLFAIASAIARAHSLAEAHTCIIRTSSTVASIHHSPRHRRRRPRRPRRRARRPTHPIPITMPPPSPSPPTSPPLSPLPRAALARCRRSRHLHRHVTTALAAALAARTVATTVARFATPAPRSAGTFFRTICLDNPAPATLVRL
jgi:hypothetical protein